jgi:ribosome-associated toxin RatA of RatAB toxin-antitoxin module
MPTIKHQLIVPYPAEAMFNLVNNIEDYPRFLPWCRSARILQQSEDEMKATLVLAKGGIHKAFTTRNILISGKMITIELIDGPFRHLDGRWQFEAITPNECQINLDLTFDFSTKILALMFGPIFHQAANSMVDAFCQEARIRYG